MPKLTHLPSSTRHTQRSSICWALALCASACSADLEQTADANQAGQQGALAVSQPADGDVIVNATPAFSGVATPGATVSLSLTCSATPDPDSDLPPRERCISRGGSVVADSSTGAWQIPFGSTIRLGCAEVPRLLHNSDCRLVVSEEDSDEETSIEFRSVYMLFDGVTPFEDTTRVRGRILHANSSSVVVTFFSEGGELGGSAAADLLPPRDSDNPALQLWQGSIDDHSLPIASYPSLTFTAEAEVVDADGRIIEVTDERVYQRLFLPVVSNP